MPSVAELQQESDRAADAFAMPRQIMRALFNQESGWQTSVTSSAGASGIAQFMPATWAGVVSQHQDLAQRFGLQGRQEERNNPLAAIWLAAAHLRDLFNMAGNIRDALVGYNAGPGQMGQPLNQLPGETQTYLNSILGPNSDDIMNMSQEEFMAWVRGQGGPDLPFSEGTIENLEGAGPEVQDALDALFPPGEQIMITGPGGLPVPLTEDVLFGFLVEDRLEIQYQLALQQAFVAAGLDAAARNAGFAAEAATIAFNRHMGQLATQNQWSVEAATVAFDRSMDMLGVQQEFTTSEREAGQDFSVQERIAAQEFSAEQAALDRDLNVRMNRLSAESSLANTIAQLQESARQQAVSLIGEDPQRGAIAARGVQALGRSPSQRFQQGLRQFATEELPSPSTSESSIGDIEQNISSLQDLAIGRPQPSLGLGAQGLPGAAHGAQITSRGLTRGTGRTAILVGEGPQGEGLRNLTAEVAIYDEDGTAEIVPLAGRAQGGFEFTPGFKRRPNESFQGLARTAGGEAPGIVAPQPPLPGLRPPTVERTGPLSGEEFQHIIDKNPPPPPGAPQGDLPPGQVAPEKTRFVADLFAAGEGNIDQTQATIALQLGMPDVARLISQLNAGLITYDEFKEGIPPQLLPLAENEFLTEAQALFPIFERLGLDFVPVGGRNESGGLGVAAGEFRSGLPRPLEGQSQDVFDRLGTQPRLIREAESGAFFFRNSAGELRKIGDESDLLSAGFNPSDAITQSESQIRGRTGNVQTLGQGEGATDISDNPFDSPPIFSPLDEEQNVGIFLPNPNQLAALWPSLSGSEKDVFLSMYGLAENSSPQDVLRSISFHTPGGLARGSVGSTRRSGVLA